MAKVKVPKRVVGVKIPKKVRKRAKKAIKLAESPVVREAAVAALGLAGGAKAMQEAGDGRGGGRGGAARHFDADTLMEAIRAAALDGVRRFLEGLEEGLRNAAATAGDAAGSVEEKEEPDRSDKSRRNGRGRSSRRDADAAARAD